ncbi:RNase adapter RapZ [Alkalibacter rhizosphaerae]|uniref:RNase adapter RapZ n=1 Tax=Alkalibacter rhizosphaerae TaxID=2815577 RepID=A0A974XDH4_9FIRM|nr:RNase adapter RapZ [Alkalibacter rhizosphaerae]QSX07813.1 RNase adapter RapZ [Alkalibacter rhizosphaerae]
MRFVIITGLSGAGKSNTIRAFEDWGFFCVDNLPPKLVPTFAELCSRSDNNIENVAVGVDSRGGVFFDDFEQVLLEMRERKFKFDLLFLEAHDNVLVTRYKESRRKHPLATESRISVAMELEREKLEKIRAMADHIIDTSSLAVKELKEELEKIYLQDMPTSGMLINVVSFGYKYGIPMDADLLFDVRFLPNPFYDEHLRALTGNDKPVQDFVLHFEQTQAFVEKLMDLLEYTIPYYEEEGKAQLVVAIGCTGGQHRSVTLVNHIQELLQKNGHWVVIDHRDIRKHLSEGEK